MTSLVNDGKGGMTVDVSAAFARAKSAQSAWAGLPWCERGRLLRKLAARARSDDELARTISSET